MNILNALPAKRDKDKRRQGKGSFLRVGCGTAATMVAVLGSAPAQLNQPVTIPLELVNINTNSDSASDPSYKLGITIGFDNNVPKLYEFDTGAAGFLAAYNTSDPNGNPSAGTVSWWNGGTPTAEQITMQYTSGNEYANSTIATTNISFYPPGQTTAGSPIATISNVSVARIGEALTVDSKTNVTTVNTAWYSALQSNAAPLQTAFYGDFGMGLYRNQGNPIVNSIGGLFAILPQFQFANGSGILPGFIVRTGGYPNATANPTPSPEVQVGITQADIDSFPYAIPLQSGFNGTSGSGITFPGSNAPTFNSAAINVDMQISLSGQSTQTASGLAMVLDTGATSTMVHEGSSLTINSGFLSGKTLVTGTAFTLSSPPWVFEQIQSGLTGQGKIGIDTSAQNPYAPLTGYLNSGLTLFFNYNVMYDLSNAMLRLQPIEPYVVPIYRTSGTQDFVIYAAMGIGGALVPYLLDTGSPQTFATYGSWWATPPPEQTTQGANLFTFAAGFGYYWTSWSTVVALGTNAGQILATTANPVNIGLITNEMSSGNQLTPQQSYTQWQANYNAGQTALGDGTFGNFGGALYGDGTFATLLAQMPLAPGLKHGYIINSGGASSLQGTVTIGLSATAIQQFQTTAGAIVLPMAALMNGGVQQFLAGGAPAYQATQVTSSHVVLNNGQYQALVPTIFDTGGGDKVVFYQDQSSTDKVPSSLISGGGNDGYILPGTAFSLTGANQSAVQQNFLGFTVENTVPTQNTLFLDSNLNTGVGGVRVNTGIQIFNQYQVMFDLDDGIVGLLPIVTPVPAPTPTPLPAPVAKVDGKKTIKTKAGTVKIKGTAVGQELFVKYKKSSGKTVTKLITIEPGGKWVFKFKPQKSTTTLKFYAENSGGARSSMQNVKVIKETD